MGTSNAGWMELWNQRESMEVTETWWFNTLELARAHGWEPAGTLVVGAGRREYSGYLPVWMQRVLVQADDARALADALARARESAVDEEATAGNAHILDLCRGGPFCISTRQADMSTMCQCDGVYEFATSPEPL